MAGGEGTRLRPLTSNAPKPMLPLVNEPMMEHIVRLLTPARLRRDRGDGRLHGQPHPHLLRRRLRLRRADGLRDRGDAARHGRLGPQRHGRARRAVPRHLRRRAHRPRPHGHRRGPRARARRWPRSGWCGWRTRSSSASSSPARTARSSGSSRSRRGVRCSATRSTPGIFVLEPEIFDYIEPDRSVDFSSEVFPAILLEAKAPLFGASGRATGRTSAPSRPTCGPTRTSSTGGSQVDIPGFEIGDGVHVGEGAEIHPEATVVGPAVIGENCRIEAGVRLGPYTVLGTNVRVRANADLERVVVHDNSYLGEGVRLRGATVGPLLRPAQRGAGRGGRRARRRVLRRVSTPCWRPG